MFDLLFQLAGTGNDVFFSFPVGFQRIGLFAYFGQFLIDRRQPFAGIRVIFLLQRLALDFQLCGSPLELVDLGWHGIDLDAQGGRRFVDEIDRFVGQEAIGDVTMRKCGGGDNGRVFDAHSVMHFVTLFKSTQNCNRVFDVRLADEHNLETTLEGRILFDVLAVFVQRCSADGAEFAAGQRRLQHIRGVDRAFRRARAHQRVQLIDEEDDLTLRVFDLF